MTKLEAPTHEFAYRLRRALNWFPLGLAYAFFYLGRYNLNAAKSAGLFTKEEYGDLFAIGSIVYAFSFLISGPLVDRFGGRKMMLFGTAGTLVMNLLMGLVLYGVSVWNWDINIFWAFAVLYGINMHFQSFGAISIVTVKAPWFHVRERGTFSTIFGVMISLGVYFAFDWGYAILDATRATLEELSGTAQIAHSILGVGGQGVDANWWLFWVPVFFLSICWIAMFAWLRNSPGEAGFANFDTGEESVSGTGERLPVHKAFWKIINHPILRVIIIIELCSGILRNGVMHWYPFFASDIGFKKEFFITQNWGLCLLVAGVTGAFLTGRLSDSLFQSRRAPMAGILYAFMFFCFGVMFFTLDSNLWFVGSMTILVSMSVIGVHGILSGTATADFAGVRNTGIAVGIVDGFVYLGSGLQSIVIGRLVPTGDAAADPANWGAWPLFLLPFTLIGFFLALKIWNAVPGKDKKKD